MRFDLRARFGRPRVFARARAAAFGFQWPLGALARRTAPAARAKISGATARETHRTRILFRADPIRFDLARAGRLPAHVFFWSCPAASRSRVCAYRRKGGGAQRAPAPARLGPCGRHSARLGRAGLRRASAEGGRTARGWRWCCAEEQAGQGRSPAFRGGAPLGKRVRAFAAAAAAAAPRAPSPHPPPTSPPPVADAARHRPPFLPLAPHRSRRSRVRAYPPTPTAHPAAGWPTALDFFGSPPPTHPTPPHPTLRHPTVLLLTAWRPLRRMRPGARPWRPPPPGAPPRMAHGP